MTESEDERDVVLRRVALCIEKRGEAMVGVAMLPQQEGVTVLSMPAHFADMDGLGGEFGQLAVHIAQAMAFVAAQREGGLADGLRAIAVKVEGNATMPLAAQHPAANDSSPSGLGEFTLAVVHEGPNAVAYVVAMDGQHAMPGQTPQVASVAVDFLEDEGVDECFRALLEAIGVAIAKAKHEDTKPAPDGPPLQ